jgi:hypothetical protein
LSTTFFISHGARKLSLFYVNDTPGFCGSNNQVSLPTKKRGDLQHIDNFPNRFRLGGFMYVGQNGNADFFSHLSQDLQTLFYADTAERMHGASVRLIKGCLEDEGYSAFRRRLLQLFRHEQNVITALDDTRSRDQEKILLKVEAEVGKNVAHLRFAAIRSVFARASLCSYAAPTKDAKSGCGSSGFDLNSGWN